jgi:hypothetical protein
LRIYFGHHISKYEESASKREFGANPERNEEMKHRNAFCFTVAGIFLLCLSQFTGADSMVPDMAPCSGDAAKFCSDVPDYGQGRCLEKHENELSAACREHRAKMVEDMKKKIEFRKACNDDIDEFCEMVRPRGNAVQKCLKKYESQLSDPCKEQVKQESVQQLMFHGRYW